MPARIPAHPFEHLLLALIMAVVAGLATVAARDAATPQDADWAPLIARATDVVDRLASGEVGPVVEQFSDQMKAALDADTLKATFATVEAQAGAFRARGPVRTEARGPFRAVIVVAVFERVALDVNVVFDADGKIGGLSIRPPAAAVAPADAYTPAPYADPSAFRAEDVTVGADGWPLPGTLTLPAGTGPFPAVVLVHGSGPNDRDESVGPNKPFRDLAEGLASRGVAVLRYDKRTRALRARVAALGDFTVKDEVVDDAAAAVGFLRARPEIRADRVFVLGHSLGGTLAPRIAVAAPDAAGLIVMAGAVRSLDQAIADQMRYLAMLDGQISEQEQAQLDQAAALGAEVRALKSNDAPIRSPLASAPASYFIDLRGYDPAAAAAQLTLPMLVLQGERDYQVTMEDFGAWHRALDSHASVTFTSYPALDHLFMAGTGPSTPAQYATPGRHVAQQVVDDIAAWITRQ